MNGAVTIDSRKNISAGMWVDLERRKIAKWIRKRNSDRKSAKNSMHWLLLAALAKIRITQEKHKASGLRCYHH